MNGEPVILYHAPAANTDGDSFVFFRHSEVIAAGNLFSTVSYPLIDATKGGTIQGVIDGLNHILDLAVAEYRAQGGTWIVPGRGRLSDTADVASYRNMLVMIRDRVRELKKKGMTLDQVKAARPTLDFDGRYGATTGPWTTNMFIEAVYKSSAGEEVMRSLFLIVAAAALTASSAFAHHSFSATYETTKQIKLEGKIVQFVYRNPHSFVHVEAPDAERRLAALGGRVGRHGAARAGRREARLAEGRRQGGHQRAAVARAGRVPRADGQPDASVRRFHLGPGATKSLTD